MAQELSTSRSGQDDVSLSSASLPSSRSLLSRLVTKASTTAAIVGLGVGAFSPKSSACLMPDSVIGPNGEINDSGYRQLGAQLLEQGHYASLRVNVPGVGTGQRNGSAAIVNSRFAITAAHNIADLLQYNPTYEISLGTNYMTARGRVVSVTKMTIHPSYDGSGNTPDIAVLELAEPVPCAGNGIGVATKDEVVLSAGCGLWGTPATGKLPRDGNVRGWQASDQGPSFFLSSLYYRDATFGYFNQGQSCNGRGMNGDSGGAVVNSSGQLVGINISAPLDIDPIGHTTYLALAQDPALLAWIKANTAVPPTLSMTVPGTVELTGEAKDVYGILAGSDLNNWEEIGTVTNQTGTVSFTDSNFTNFPSRYYKATLK